MRSRLNVAALGLVAIGMIFGPTGCLVDSDEPCGAGFILTEDDACECAEGSVFDPESNGCIPCGDNEVETNGSCICDEGYTRQGDACVAGPPGWGDLCSTTGSPCPGSLDCYAETGTSGYCTSLGCTGDDCFAGYVCDTSGATSFCKAPPFGQGRPCAGPSDCAGTEATYCDTFMSKTCLVPGCTVTPNDCFQGWLCCDLTTVGASTLCIHQDEAPSSTFTCSDPM